MTDSKDETIQSENENSDVENSQENDVDTGTPSSSNEEESSVSDGKVVKFDPNTENFTPTQPGIYTLPSLQPPLYFAVNLPPAESRTDPLDDEAISALNLPVLPENDDSSKIVKNSEQPMNDRVLEDDRKLWRWLILAAILLILVETWLGGWLARRPAKEEVTGGEHEVAPS